MRIETDIKLDFKDVLIRPKRSRMASRADVDLYRAYNFLHHSKFGYFGIPIIAANMDGVGTFAMAKSLKQHSLMTALTKFTEIENPTEWSSSLSSNDVFYTLGPSEYLKFKDWHRKVPIRYVCIDAANGYTETFVTFVKSFRELHPDITIMAGNVVTAEMTEELLLSGADIVKVGLGSGSACRTRAVTGVGYPQLSAIIECADAAHGLGGLICSDGGCRESGDIAKAFGAGADFVMLGGMLAGHDESGTQEFHGMSSTEAMMKHYGKVNEYRASEGSAVLLPPRGPVSASVSSILGGLRSACTYVGAESLKQLPRRTTFVRVNS